MSKLYELVLYTASLSMYAIPLMEKLDPNKLISHHLFRNHCSLLSNTFVKDLSLLGRQLERTIIIDNTPSSYMLQPDNAVSVKTWVGDPLDKELIELIPLLETLSRCKDVRKHLSKHCSLLQSRVKKHRYVSSLLQPEPVIKPKAISLLANKGPVEDMSKDASSVDIFSGTAKSLTKSNLFSNKMSLKIEGCKLENDSNSRTRLGTAPRMIQLAATSRHSTDPNSTPLSEVVQSSPEVFAPEKFRVKKVESLRAALRTAEVSARDMIKSIRHVGPLIQPVPPYLTPREVNTPEIKVRRDFLLKYMY
eukprot:TRINITY_DN12171_c0_g2_i1.p1 TRINITY_DN12171_c0_g2~~TRINITY_DN12171_c0_g2_i1.p1  ORF type:complete len:306 (-),score=38.02 TRINITY_DN12171_c0_g2_i1:160-1077(-)